MSLDAIESAINRLRDISERARYATRIRDFVTATEAKEPPRLSVENGSNFGGLYNEVLDEYARRDILLALSACAKRHEVAVSIVLDDLKPRDRVEYVAPEQTPSVPS